MAITIESLHDGGWNKAKVSKQGVVHPEHIGKGAQYTLKDGGKLPRGGAASYRGGMLAGVADVISLGKSGRAAMARSNPKARQETADKLIARLAKDIEAGADDHSKAFAVGYVCAGRNGQRWKIESTDGHRALLVRADNEDVTAKGEKLNLSEGGWTPLKITGQAGGCVLIHDGEFQLALKRAKVMTDSIKGSSRQVKLTFNAGKLLVESKCEGGSFDEELKALGEYLMPVSVLFNVDYLIDLCGVWPLKVWWGKDAGKGHWVFGDAGDSFRVALMPMKP